MSSEPQRLDYDVFLSHSAKDKPVVRDVAEGMRKDGRVPKAEGSRMKAKVPLHPSAFILHPFPDWAQLESGTFRFRDPLNKERRFLPLRVEELPKPSNTR